MTNTKKGGENVSKIPGWVEICWSDGDSVAHTKLTQLRTQVSDSVAHTKLTQLRTQVSDSVVHTKLTQLYIQTLGG